MYYFNVYFWPQKRASRGGGHRLRLISGDNHSNYDYLRQENTLQPTPAKHQRLIIVKTCVSDRSQNRLDSL